MAVLVQVSRFEQILLQRDVIGAVTYFLGLQQPIVN